MTHDQKKLLLAIWLTNQHSWPYLRPYADKVPDLRQNIRCLSLCLGRTRYAGATWEEAVAAVVELAMGQPHPILAKWAADRQAVPEMAITWDNTFRNWKPVKTDPCYHKRHFQARVEANKQAIWLALAMEQLSANDKSK
jgi:hypothetical protein